MTGFGDSKRPAPTIEGKATEIVEPKDEASAADAAPDVASTESAGEPEQPRPKAKAPPRTSMPELKSFVTHLAAGLLGGLIAVLALSFFGNKLPARNETAAQPDLSKIEQRIGALESAPKGAVDLSALDQRVQALETKAPEPAPAPDLSELNGRVARLEASLKTLGETASAGGSVADAAALDAKLGELEQRLQARVDAKLAEDETSDQSMRSTR